MPTVDVDIDGIATHGEGSGSGPPILQYVRDNRLQAVVDRMPSLVQGPRH